MDIKEISQEIHNDAREKGFWDKDRNTGEVLMLVVSELGEALEADRKRKFAKKGAFGIDMGVFCPEDSDIDPNEYFKNRFEERIKDTFQDEIADAVIRLFDLAEGFGIDLEWHIRTKLDYNKLRPKLHGKKY